MNFCLKRFFLAGLLFSLVFMVGCPKKDPRQKDLVPAAGKIFYKGEPVEGASIVFLNENKEKQGGSALSGPGGAFVLSTYGPADGTLPGKYRVTVSKSEYVSAVSDDEMLRLEREGKDVPGGTTKHYVPEKYGDRTKTPLEIEIPPQGNKEIKLELTD